MHVKSEESTTYGKVGDVERIYRCLIDMCAASDDTRYHIRVRRCHTPASTQAHTPAHSGSAHCPYSSRDTADQSRRRRRQSTGCSLQNQMDTSQRTVKRNVVSCAWLIPGTRTVYVDVA